jgi:hypothetical protein
MSTPAKLEAAHKLIMQSAIGPSEALIRKKGSRAQLQQSVDKMKAAIEILEGIINA